MIVFVQPVTGHASNSNGWPPSCGITTMLCIIGVGSACPSCTSLTWSSFVRPSRTVVVDRRLVAGSMVGVVHHCTCRESFAVSVGFYIRFCSALFSTEITYHAACGTCVSRVPSFTLGTATTALVRWTLPNRLAVIALLVVPSGLSLFFIVGQPFYIVIVRTSLLVFVERWGFLFCRDTSYIFGWFRAHGNLGRVCILL